MGKRMMVNFGKAGFPHYEEVEEEGMAKPCAMGLPWGESRYRQNAGVEAGQTDRPQRGDPGNCRKRRRKPRQNLMSKSSSLGGDAWPDALFVGNAVFSGCWEAIAKSGSPSGSNKGVFMKTHPKKITTGLAVKIIIKGALLTILKVHPRQTGSTFQG